MSRNIHNKLINRTLPENVFLTFHLIELTECRCKTLIKSYIPDLAMSHEHSFSGSSVILVHKKTRSIHQELQRVTKPTHNKFIEVEP
jgi:kynureninase